MTDRRFPLNWPTGWPRTAQHKRRPGPFKVPPGQARDELIDELSRLGARDIIISTDQPLNRDGTPSMARRIISDPGVAVYFNRKDREVVLACDQYDELHDNMRAIGKTAEAMRGIERWGASELLDRAFTGFEALPAPEQWWQVLGTSQQADLREIERAYREQAKTAHPDRGGTDAAMARLNAARDAGLQASRR